ncbi:hypothetical protein FRX31_014781 [Thalictrum thalictroides]|uniref:DUF4283 domain-containing protein n=1 Tax=Thalictrum thalictroides TaxID=46969 RepID=A0A7J6WHS4_THATH|nr:hypothetical protein FRX31_014781 [Thalictrum thalictroides]
MENQVHNLTTAITTSLALPNQTMRMRIPIDMLTANGDMWNHTLIFTLMEGGHLNPNQVMRTVKIKWRVTEVCDMVRAGHNRFVCRFTNLNDHERIEEQQPWVVMGCLILMESFSTGMVAANVKFERLPLWMSFKGLELEHLQSETVRMIGSAAGDVTSVLPVGVIPRSAEGFRARVNVNVNEPLVQGYPVNTLANGDVWVAFRYNNLPALYCSLCLRLGHVRHQCNFQPAPTTTTTDEQNQDDDCHTVVQNATGFLSRQIIVWPHQQNQTQATVVEQGQSSTPQQDTIWTKPMGQNHSNSTCTKIAQTWASVGLISAEEAQTIETQPKNQTQGNHSVLDLDLTDQAGSNLLDEAQLFATNEEVVAAPPPPPTLIGIQRQQPLIITEPSSEAVVPRRGRGRPPGSANKITKAQKDLKGKGKLFQEDVSPIKGKKRKITTEESMSSMVAYIPDPTPLPRVNSQSRATTDNSDLISQMFANPELTNLLIRQGALNPRLINRLAEYASNPNPNSFNWQNTTPLSPIQEIHNNFETPPVQTNISAISHTNPTEFEDHHITRSNTGEFEYRTADMEFVNSLGVQNNRDHDAQNLLLPPLSEQYNQGLW